MSKKTFKVLAAIYLLSLIIPIITANQYFFMISAIIGLVLVYQTRNSLKESLEIKTKNVFIRKGILYVTLPLTMIVYLTAIVILGMVFINAIPTLSQYFPTSRFASIDTLIPYGFMYLFQIELDYKNLTQIYLSIGILSFFWILSFSFFGNLAIETQKWIEKNK